ncbi:MAG TPA: tetratricopeptide repeat protein, partial [Usitatibacter sp.]|nr:tetratricopeptide repeat protein [Usitatibacter sp.]
MPLEALLDQSRKLIAAGRWREAKPLLERLAEQPRCERAVLLQLAELELLEGQAERARERATALDPERDDEAAFVVARADEALGRLDAARERLVALRTRLATPSAPLELHLGRVYERLGEPHAALDRWRAALALQPTLSAAHQHLATLLAQLGRLEEAREALENALAVLPGEARLWILLAQAQTRLGDAAAALASLERAAAAAPLSARAWTEIGHAYAEHWRHQEASDALARASSLDPGDAQTESLWSLVLQELGDTPRALKALERARARQPEDLRVVVAERLLLPQIYADVAELARWRQRYREGLATLLDESARWRARASEVFGLEHHNFFLAYQGEDDRDLQHQYSRFLGQLTAAAAPEWHAPLARRFDGGRRLRVGFLGALFRDCTAGRYFERWITGLDPRRFERFVYHTAPLSDHFTQRIASHSEHFAPLHLGPREAAARLLADELDVLIYPEVGMHSLTYLLATLRLAPVQCAGWGHPVTTGSELIDYYFTCA